MSFIEEKEAQLRAQVIPQTKEEDFEAFWESELGKMREVPLKVEKRLMDLPYKTFKAYEVTFNAHDGTEIVGYYCVPCTYEGKPLPCVSVHHGGGGAYGIYPEIVATGVCTFSIDNRSQCGKTFDRADYDVLMDYRGGIMTHGLLDERGYYMKNLYLDAVRSVDVIATFPEVDPEKIVSYGISQGGALSIAAAALSGRVKRAYPTVPSYSCLKNRVELGSGVFEAVKYYLLRNPEMTDRALKTLSYFDINNMVSLLKVPTAFFLGLSDTTCLPPFVYSAYAHTSAQKRITISPFTPHNISTEYYEKILKEFSEL